MHLLYSGQTVMIGCNHTSFEWTRAVRHIYGIIRHMQGLYGKYMISSTLRMEKVYQFNGIPKKVEFEESQLSNHIL